MNFTLKRKQYRADGIFSDLIDETGAVFCVSLEHDYLVDGGYKPKLYPGTFTCVRGQHRLESMTHDFTTFEITGVKGHKNILYHPGNFNKDSEGCLLLGEKIANSGSGEMVTNSRATFDKFMALQSGIDTFTLTVVE